MDYCERDLVRIAKRENNTKRTYLVVDPLQGKHVPVSPTKALALFERLAGEIQGKYPGERLLLVGFAETATAIGAQAAISLGTKYIQTTREAVPGAEYLFFSETHSHATEQKLVKDEIDGAMDEIDRIIFVEDEVTTGNTIRNIIRLIRREYGDRVRFAVLSLLNGMTGEFLCGYEAEGIDLHYLVKTDHSGYGDIADGFSADGTYFEADNTASEPEVCEIGGRMDTRRMVDASAYETACRELAEEVIRRTIAGTERRILVLGTEEFMYPALYTGKELENRGYEVRCHATTRSPIAVSSMQEYPLHERFALRSLYDADRKTFLYDIGRYDRVLVLTDAEPADSRGLRTLAGALGRQNSEINIIRWC